VLRTWIPKARADSDRALRADVEGTNSAGALWPRFRPAFVSAYDPGEYADYARAAKEVRTILGRRGGENAVRAAFFQGHVELIGLQPGGGMAAAPTAPADEVLVPAGMTTLADFATMTGLSAAQLRRANPGLSGAAVTPGAALRAPGCRFHVVVAAQDVLAFLGIDIPIAAREPRGRLRRPHPRRPHPDPPPLTMTTDQNPIDAVRALAAGEYERWHGVPPGLDRATVDAALDSGDASPERSGRLGGLPAVYRMYPPTDGAPFGVQVWFEGERVSVLEIREPPLRAPLDEWLGEPEARVPSGLGGSYRQWVYAGRGLTFHVSRVTGEALRLYAYPACPTERFLEHPLSRVERRRIPR
jgi:hypothetical protein